MVHVEFIEQAGAQRSHDGLAQGPKLTAEDDQARTLAGQGPRLVVIGGELRALSQALVGPLSTKVLDELYLDHAFVGTFSLSLDAGMTTTDPAEAFTKEHVLAHARESVLLVDGSKLGTRSFAQAGRLDQIDVVITDIALDEEASATFEHAGVRVLVA